MILVSALPAGVGFGDGQAEGLQLGDEGAQPPLVVEPVLVVGELVVGEEPGDGLAGDFAGPLVVGAVQEAGAIRSSLAATASNKGICMVRQNRTTGGESGEVRNEIRSEERRVGKEGRSRWSP